MKTKKEFIIDADTLMNEWRGIKCMCNARLFLSASNFLLLKTLFAISLETVADVDINKLEWYLDEHKVLATIIDNKEINTAFNDFLSDSNTYMRTITVSKKNNLELVIFKGFCLDKTEDTDIAPTIEEIVAYGEFRKQDNREIPLILSNDLVVDFCKEFGFNFDIIDFRQ